MTPKEEVHPLPVNINLLRVRRVCVHRQLRRSPRTIFTDIVPSTHFWQPSRGAIWMSHQRTCLP